MQVRPDSKFTKTGATPYVIDKCLNVAEELDVQVNIHTDTLNEAGFVEDSLRSFNGRAIHTYHTEGAGGGHADLLRVASMPNVLPPQPVRPCPIR